MDCSLLSYNQCVIMSSFGSSFCSLFILTSDSFWGGSVGMYCLLGFIINFLECCSILMSFYPDLLLKYWNENSIFLFRRILQIYFINLISMHFILWSFLSTVIFYPDKNEFMFNNFIFFVNKIICASQQIHHNPTWFPLNFNLTPPTNPTPNYVNNWTSLKFD